LADYGGLPLGRHALDGGCHGPFPEPFGLQLRQREDIAHIVPHRQRPILPRQQVAAVPEPERARRFVGRALVAIHGIDEQRRDRHAA
jgi:hypothetical protein